METKQDKEDIKLDQLLMKAADTTPLYSYAQISQLVHNSATKESNVFRYILLAAGIALVLTLVFFLGRKAAVPQASVNNAFESPELIAPIVPEKETLQAPEASKPIKAPRNNIRTDMAAGKPAANKTTTPLLFFPNTPPSSAWVETADDAATPELTLSLQELRNLHIYTDFHELKFVTLNDSSLTDRKKLQKSEEHLYFYKWVQTQGGGYTYNNRTQYNAKIKQHLDSVNIPACPVMLDQIVRAVDMAKSSQKPGDTTTYIIEPRVLELGSAFENEVRTQLVPVKVSLQAIPDIYGKTDHDLIFWYKPTAAFIKCLSAENAAMVKSRYANFSEETFEQRCTSLVEEYHRLEKVNLVRAKQSDTLLQQAITLNKMQLKQLGFKVTKKGVVSYECRYRNTRFKLIMNGPFSSRLRSDVHIKRPQKAYAMFYCKSMQDLEIIPTYMLPDDAINKSREEVAQATWKIFEEEVSKLVPVKVNVKGGLIYYFWFPTFDVYIKD